jgi:hypothetical protein
MPEYSPRDRLAPAAVEYMTALDTLIDSRRERCPSPLSQDTGARLFPVIAVRQRDRLDKRSSHRINRQVKQESRLHDQKIRRYQQRLAQAKIDLTFQTPLTVGARYARQQEQEFFEFDIRPSLSVTVMTKFPRQQNLFPVFFPAVNFAFPGIGIHDFKNGEGNILKPIRISGPECLFEADVTAMA